MGKRAAVAWAFQGRENNITKKSVGVQTTEKGEKKHTQVYTPKTPWGGVGNEAEYFGRGKWGGENIKRKQRETDYAQHLACSRAQSDRDSPSFEGRLDDVDPFGQQVQVFLKILLA